MQAQLLNITISIISAWQLCYFNNYTLQLIN